MFDGLIKIALKSALENSEIKEKLRRKNHEINLNSIVKEDENNIIINLDKNNYMVLKE